MSATLNTPDAPASVRAPRLRVLLGQTEIPGAIHASVTANNWYQADRFTLGFALAADPAYGAAWWAAQTDMLLDVQVGIDGAWKSMIVGAVDVVDVELASGLVTVDGRDLAARFIETKTQETFANRTASEIVGILAARHGMTADATATTTLAGTYWKQDHANITLGMFSRQTSEWDLLTALARYEGFDLYVTGTVLHFHPAVAPDATPWVVNWTPESADTLRRSNAIDLRLHRALTLARDIQVDVHSWHSGHGRGFTKSARAIGAKSASATTAANQTGYASNTQRYVLVRPNLTEDQALKLAQATLADLSKHERVISWAEPGELTLTPRNLVQLRGTGTGFDQTYYIDSIERTISFQQGFTQHVRAKNRDARSQAAVA